MEIGKNFVSSKGAGVRQCFFACRNLELRIKHIMNIIESISVIHASVIKHIFASDDYRKQA